MSRGLFDSVRCLGTVTSGTAVDGYSLGGQQFIVAAVGFGYVIYNADTLRIVFTSEVFPHLLSAVHCGANRRQLIYVSHFNTDLISAHSRHEEIFRTHTALKETILQLQTFGDILIAIAPDGIQLFDANCGDSLAILPLQQFLPIGGSPGKAAIYHHLGKINEFLVGGAGCSLGLINVVEERVLIRFEGIRRALADKLEEWSRPLEQPSLLSDWSVSSITGSGGESRGVFVAVHSTRPEHQGSLSPVIFALDEEADQVLLTMVLSKDQLKVNAMALQTGSPVPSKKSGYPGNYTLLYSGCANGDLIIFNIDDGTSTTLERAHQEGGFASLQILSDGGEGGCQILSSGFDNSIKIFHLEDISELPKLLKQRQGFNGIINQMSFYDQDDEAKELIVTSNEWTQNSPLPDNLPSFGAGEIFARQRGLSQGSSSVGKISYVLSQQDCVFPTSKSLKKLKSVWRNHLAQLPPVTHLAFNRDRHYDWPNIVTCHRGLHQAMLWSAKDKTLVAAGLERPAKGGAEDFSGEATLAVAFGDLSKLKSQRALTEKRSSAVCARISQCGHFVVVGYEDGQMHHFNLQSRRHIGIFRCDPPAVKAEDEELEQLAVDAVYEVNPNKMVRKRAALRRKVQAAATRTLPQVDHPRVHQGPVRFIEIQQSSRVISCAATCDDLTIATWDLTAKKELNRLDLKELIASHPKLSELSNERLKVARFSVDGCLASVALIGDTKSIVLFVDLSRSEIVRRFGPIEGTIVDSQTSPLGDTVAIASIVEREKRLAGHLRVYNVLSSLLVDWSEFPAPICAFTHHPSGAYLITAHCADEKSSAFFPQGGLYVWANLALFGEKEPTASPTRPRLMSFPPLLEDERDVNSPDPCVTETPGEVVRLEQVKVKKLLQGACTSDKWNRQMLKALMTWDEIKAKSVPEKEPEKPEEAPFFLYSEQSLSGRVEKDMEEKEEIEEEDMKEEILGGSRKGSGSELTSRLLAVGDVKTKKGRRACMRLLEDLEMVSVPGLHRFLLSLSSKDLQEEMNRCFVVWVEARRVSDLVQAMLKLYLTLHGEALLHNLKNASDEASQAQVEILRQIMQHTSQTWDSLSQSLDRLICYIKHATMLQLD